MAFFDDISKKISEVSQSAAGKTRDTADLFKLKGEISDEEKKLTSLYAEIGKLYCTLHSEDFEPQFQGLMAGVKETVSGIADRQAQIQRIKKISICSNCGAEVSLENRYCIACGAPRVTNPNNTTCVNCGKIIEEGNRFCIYCGTPVSNGQVVSAPSPGPIFATPAAPTVPAAPVAPVAPVGGYAPVTPVAPVVPVETPVPTAPIAPAEVSVPVAPVEYAPVTPANVPSVPDGVNVPTETIN